MVLYEFFRSCVSALLIDKLHIIIFCKSLAGGQTDISHKKAVNNSGGGDCKTHYKHICAIKISMWFGFGEYKAFVIPYVWAYSLLSIIFLHRSSRRVLDLVRSNMI